MEKGSGFWAAVTPIPDGVVKAKNVASSLNATPELDEYGFPALDPDLFQGKERDATLEECVSGLKADPFHFSRVEPILKKRSDGNYGMILNMIVLFKLLIGAQTLVTTKLRTFLLRAKMPVHPKKVLHLGSPRRNVHQRNLVKIIRKNGL